MSEKGLSPHQLEALTQAFYDHRANYVGWYDPDEFEYFSLPDDHLPTDELGSLLRSIHFEMSDEDWEQVKDMETIHLEDFKAVMTNKVNDPQIIMMGGAPGVVSGVRFSDGQLFNSSGDEFEEQPYDFENPSRLWSNVSLDTIHEWAVRRY